MSPTAKFGLREATTSLTGDADYADGLGHVLPPPAAGAKAIGEMQMGGLGP
jgi:hypothetical protein